MSFNYMVILKTAAMVALLVGFTMIFPVIVAFSYGEIIVAKGFLFTLIPSIIIGILLLLFIKPKESHLTIRDGYLIVTVCWVLAACIGAIPYLISGTVTNFIDAFFESTSGFTTTGISVLHDVTTLPKGLLFWRSFSHWLGGIGILVFAISILPALGIGGQMIAKAETPSPTIEKISTRMSDSAKRLYLMYGILTIIAIVLLKLCGLNLFESLVHAFSCMGTGGLSTYTSGVAYYDSIFVETIVTTFSLLASINFVLYSHVLRGHWKDFFADAELRAFFSILIGVLLLITFNLWISGTYDTFLSSLKHSFFQTSAFMSTAGYYTANYSLWPTFSQSLLFILLLIGGCSASTCGSIKVIRVLVLFKLIIRGIAKRLHPSAVVPVKLSGKTVSAERISGITTFILVYIGLFILSGVVVTFDNYDFVTSFSAAAAALSNTGMGMGMVGPTGSFEIFSPFVRVWLSIAMLAGRLELFTILLLFVPSFWNPAKRIKV